MVEIVLKNGIITLVDDEYFYLSKIKWTLDSHGYPSVNIKRQNGVYRLFYLHHAVIKPSKVFEVDHINGNPLDNRKENLRLVTHRQNLQNRKENRGHKKSSSIYPGVYKIKNSNRWKSHIFMNGKDVYLGYFSTELEAYESYKRALEINNL